MLPNLITTTALFSGFYAIVVSTQGQFETAAMAIFIAMLLDGMDGRVARLTNTQTKFGAEYDSLADMISFGLAPALTIYQWALVHMGELGSAWGKVGWLAAFFYVACAALRLALFNTRSSSTDKRYFSGLPSPAAAAVITGFVWMLHELGVPGESLQWSSLFLTLACGALMVSKVSYYSFKDFDLQHRIPFVLMLLVLLVFALMTIDPPKVLFIIFFSYALSGLWLWTWRRLRRNKQRFLKEEPVDDVNNHKP